MTNTFSIPYIRPEIDHAPYVTIHPPMRYASPYRPLPIVHHKTPRLTEAFVVRRGESLRWG